MEVKDVTSRNIDNEVSVIEVLRKFKGIIRSLFKKWMILLLAALIGGGGGYLYTKSKDPIYTATTTFVIETGDDGGGIGQYAGIASMMGVDLGGGSGSIFQGDNILELYRSRKMIEAALLTPVSYDSSKLVIDLYLDQSGLKEKWKKNKPDLLTINFKKNKQINSLLQRKRDSILGNVVFDINRKNLSVGKLDKKLALMKIDVSSKNEFFSKEFNNSLVNEVNTFYISTKTKKSLNSIQILQGKADSVKGVMNGAIISAAIAIDNTPNLNPTKQVQRIAPAQRSQFTAETNRAVLSQLIQNLEMSKVGLLKETPLIQIVDEPIYPLKVDEINLIKEVVLFSFVAVFLLSVILILIPFLNKI
jgi:hypothetical protein